ncbi:hypothetical protein O8W32_03930 [Methanomassiliicoccales archaeon LGM-DZ1]|nr:hypothetical protein O8W32_03930 [Methanomassiliicoccales archaeon LGM-DZ1]
MENNEDSPSRPVRKDAKPPYSGSSAQPSGRSPDSHRSYQGGDRQGYRSDRGSQGGYRSDRPSQGQSSGYRSDRSQSSGGYRSDRGSSGGYHSDRPQGGYRSDRPSQGQSSGGYRSDRGSSGGYRSDRAPSSGGYRSDRGSQGQSSGGYRSDRGSSGGYHSDRPQGGYRSDRPSQGQSSGYRSDRAPSTGGSSEQSQRGFRPQQGDAPAQRRRFEGEDSGDAREGLVSDSHDDTDDAPAGVRGIKIPKRNDANYTRSYKGSAQKAPSRSPNRQNRRGSGSGSRGGRTSSRQPMLNTHRLAPFKYDMNEVLSQSSMDPTMASSFLATVIAKASRISTRDAKDYVQTFVEAGNLTKDESVSINRLLDRYSMYR